MFSGAVPVSLTCINCLKDIVGKNADVLFVQELSLRMNFGKLGPTTYDK